MNDFLSWYRHLLISFLFHDLTSLYPLSFHGNDCSTCSTHFSLLGKAPTKRSATPRRVHARLCACALAHTDYARARAHEPIRDHAENGVVYCSSVKNRTVYIYTLEMSGWRVTIARRSCTPPLPLEAFSENICASTGSSKEIAGLKKKMTRKSWYRVSAFSLLEIRR